MNMDSNPKRRLRIEGNQDDVHGYQLSITDVETGERIANIIAVTVHLSATSRNYAEVTYYSKEDIERYVTYRQQPVENIVEVENPQVAVTSDGHTVSSRHPLQGKAWKQEKRG